MLIEPIVLEIFLNKNNYKDRILISEFNKKANRIFLFDDSNSSFYLNCDEVEDIIYNKWKKEIENFRGASPKNLQNTYNSIYFLESVIREFPSLKYFRVQISDVQEINTEEILYDYRIIHTKIDLATKLEDDYLEYVCDLFKSIGVYTPNYYNPKPYIEIHIRELYNKLYKKASEYDENSEEFLEIENFINILGKKIEFDDSIALIILKK